MPKETLTIRDGSEVTIGWDEHGAQIGIDLGEPFSFRDGSQEYTSLWTSLTLEDITALQKTLARAKRRIQK
jgi:hypothetical protein